MFLMSNKWAGYNLKIHLNNHNMVFSYTMTIIIFLKFKALVVFGRLVVFETVYSWMDWNLLSTSQSYTSFCFHLPSYSTHVILILNKILRSILYYTFKVFNKWHVRKPLLIPMTQTYNLSLLTCLNSASFEKFITP